MQFISKYWTIFVTLVVSFGMTFLLGSCKPDEPVGPDGPSDKPGNDTTEVVTPLFEVTFKEASSSSITFTVTTEHIAQVAYDVLLASEEGYVDPLNLFDNGTVVEVAEDGSIDVVVESLSHNTPYKGYFAALTSQGENLADMIVVEGSTIDFDEDVVVYDVTSNSFRVQFRMPALQDDENVIKWGLTELATYNMQSKMSMFGYQTDAQILNLSDDVYHNYMRNDTIFLFNEENSIVYDENGNPVDDGMGGILTYYLPIVPGQPNILLFGEFAWGEHPWGFGTGYYAPLFREEDFLNDYYANQGPGPRSADENTLDEADYWTGYYHKAEFLAAQPVSFDADFNVEMNLTPKGGRITINPDESIYQYVYMMLDQYTYDMVLPYLNNDPTLMQWYITSYNASITLGAMTSKGPMAFDLEEIFYEMERDLTYYLFLVGMSDETGLSQVYEKIEIVLPEPTKPAPEIVVSHIENPYGDESPYQIWFNIKAPNGDVDAANYLCNYSRDFEKILDLGETYSNYMYYYGQEFSDAEVMAINSEEGYNVMFTSHPNVESRLIVQAYNDEGTPNNPDEDEDCIANGKTIRVLPKEMVESPLFNDLDGEWTATANVWYNTYINNQLTRIDTTVVSKVLIGKPYHPETLSESDYAIYEEALGDDYSKEYVDILYEDFKQEADIFYEDVRSQNRILCLGLDFAYDTWNEKRIGSATPYELFTHDSYGSINNAAIFYDFGNKWYLEVDAEGNVTAPMNSDRLYPTNNWNYSSELYLSAITPADANGVAYSIMKPNGDPEIWPAFDVEVSEDNNTITIKSYELNGLPAYPNLGYENWGYTYIVSWTVCSEIVLTRGWDSANDYPYIGGPSSASSVAAAQSVSGVVSPVTKPHSRTVVLPLPKVDYKTTDYKAVTCEEFQHRVIDLVNSTTRLR